MKGRWSVLLATALIAGAISAITGAATRPAMAGAFPGTNGKIAFVSDRDGFNSQIYTMNPNGSGLKKLTNLKTIYSGSYNPSFSADGTRIVFDRNGEVWVMNADGTGQRQSTDNSVYDHDPTFSPNGNKIAFLTRRGADGPPGQDNIWVMNTDGSNQTRLTSGSSASEPTWSPDGTKIAFIRGGELWVMNSNGTGQTQYTTNETDYKYATSAVDHPTWSPDGGTIEFAAVGRNGCTCWDYFSIKIGGAMMPTNLGLAASPSDKHLAFSPDGSRLALQSNRSGNVDIYTMNPDGSSQANVTNDSAAQDSEPDWGVRVTQQSTTLSLSARPTTITSGEASTLSGRLLTSSGQLYAGQRITIEQKPKGATSFSTLKTVSTGFDGMITLSVKPEKSTYYRALYAGNAVLGLGRSASDTELVSVSG
ncbi:MAG: LpqB family beta-propeller domain-containing protein [Actinomycetota bacterium]|nr:LpqB family beta-propeller domain-containing protein [Actinomycetota bacterium]